MAEEKSRATLRCEPVNTPTFRSGIGRAIYDPLFLLFVTEVSEIERVLEPGGFGIMTQDDKFQSGVWRMGIYTAAFYDGLHDVCQKIKPSEVDISNTYYYQNKVYEGQLNQLLITKSQ